MPVFAVLAAAAQVRHGVDAAHLHPHQVADAEGRRQRDVEAAVAIQQRRVLAVELQAFLVGDDHRHARAVFAVVEDLLRFVVRRVEIDLRRAEDRAAARPHVVAVDRRRRRVAREAVEGLLVRALAAEAAGGADAGQLDLAHLLAAQVIHLDLRVRVFQVRGHQQAADDVGAFERLRRLRDDFFPGSGLRLGNVDRNDPTARRVLVGAQPEGRAVVVNETVARVTLIE